MRWFVRLSCVCSAILLALSGCSRGIDSPEKLGELVVGVREAPALFQPDGDGADAGGFNHDLTEIYAATLGLKVRYVTDRDPLRLVQQLREGKLHFIASLPIDPEAKGVRFSLPIRTAQPVLVRHADALGPGSLTELAGRTVETVAGTPQAAYLKSINADKRPLIVERGDIDDIALLERVADRRSELAASDTLSFQVAANFYPDIAIVDELPGELRFAWAFSANDSALSERAGEFLAHIGKDGTLARIADRYFGHVKRIDSADIATFLERRVSVLGKFRRDFVAAQEVTGIDWRLLAALAYQESQWDPLATSPTGVRGMMMLTEDTADSMNVTNRLDAAQSIRAGSAYLSSMIEALPPSVIEPDRTWLALAAYNIGMGHLKGARQFAVSLKQDPNSWYEMKKVLPLLSRPQYYRRLKSGRARGGEAVIMVENVRGYYDVLARFETALKFTLTPTFPNTAKVLKRK